MTVITRFNFDPIYRDHPDYYGLEPSHLLREAVIGQGWTSGEALDVGGGQGRDALFLAQRGFAVTVLDISPVSMAQLHSATQHDSHPIHCVVGDALDYDYPTERFAVINASTVLDHLPGSEVPVVAGGIMRALAPGGLGHVMVFTERDPGFLVRRAQREQARERMSETADAIEHYFAGTAELEHLFGPMEILRAEEFTIEDRKHGPVHDHYIAAIVFRKPGGP